MRPKPSMRLTIPRLKDISRQISDGNPWWGMVVANEYLDPSSPMHGALVAKFAAYIGEEPFEPELATKLISGCRFEDLSDLLKSRLGARHTPGFRREYHPRKFNWLRSRHRVAKSYRLAVDHRKLRGLVRKSFSQEPRTRAIITASGRDLSNNSQRFKKRG